MTKEEIRENNILIAKFLGYEYISKGMWKVIDAELNNSPIIEKHSKLIHFHSDWNCLMKAVQKINKSKGNYTISITNLVIIDKWEDDIFEWCPIGGFSYNLTIEGVYQAVIETIKLINNEHK